MINVNIHFGAGCTIIASNFGESLLQAFKQRKFYLAVCHHQCETECLTFFDIRWILMSRKLDAARKCFLLYSSVAPENIATEVKTGGERNKIFQDSTYLVSTVFSKLITPNKPTVRFSTSTLCKDVH
jgi:hypothetical protein